MDQARYRLLSNSTSLDCLNVGDFELVRDIALSRLLEALCLEERPDDILFDQLLADMLTVSVLVRDDVGVESESMRNYSYKLRDYAGSWEMLKNKSGDLLYRFNACPSGIIMQKNLADRIYGIAQ